MYILYKQLLVLINVITEIICCEMNDGYDYKRDPNSNVINIAHFYLKVRINMFDI